MELNLCFIFSAAVIGLPLHFDEHVEKKIRFPYLVHKSNRPHFLGAYWAINPPGMLREHLNLSL